jgi:lysophospholipid acyltransferase (LPLAT)-like uncharacterized protein
MQTWWKNPRVVGKAAYWLMRFLKCTMRIKVKINATIDPKTTYLFAFWHGKQFLPAAMIFNTHKTPMCVMTSPSRDGAMLAVFLEKIGYEVIRGSSRDGGAAALINMKTKLEAGTSIGFGIDGPIGPIHVVKPGVAFLAQKCKVKIIPVGSAFSRYWIFSKAWDKFQLPKPFSKAALVLGDPFEVNANVDLKQACLDLEKSLHAADEEAASILN